MDAIFPITNGRIPPRPRYLIDRVALTALFEREIPHYPLTVVSAPAGYGKTTTLAQWARASRFRIIWLSISAEDNDADRFVRALVAAWVRVDARVAETELGLLASAAASDRNAILSALLRDAANHDEHIVFIADDSHLLDDPAIFESLTFVLAHAPPTLHFVLAGRAEPPLPLARYRARQALLEFGSSDLAFSQTETGDFLRSLAGLALADDQVAALHEQSEGWPAALQLVLLTHRHRPAAVRMPSVSGRHRYITDYLAQEVLGQLRDETQRFVMRVSILDRLCPSLCDAVSGRSDSQILLESLERENLFLFPLDDERVWYRFHRLFADFLRAELTQRHPTEIAELQRRATDWFLSHDLPEQAFAHALATGDASLVLQIFERYLNVKLNTGETKVIARWLAALPPAWYNEQPLFGLCQASLRAITGDFRGCLRSIDTAEAQLQRLDANDARWQFALIHAVRCFLACIQNDLELAESYAEQALPTLREESRAFRATIYHALGDTYRRHGRWAEARTAYLKIPECISGVPGYRLQFAVQSAHVFGALADLESRRGRLRDAARYWEQALDALRRPESWGHRELPVAGWVHLRLGEVLYQWNDLPAAREQLSAGLTRAELGGDVRTMMAGYLLAARLSLAAGAVEAAHDVLQRARPLVEQTPFPEWTSQFERVQIELWLAQQQFRAAIDWAESMLDDASLAERPESEVTRLSVVRVLIDRGNPRAQARARTLLHRLVEEATVTGRTGLEIEALALRGMTSAFDGNPIRAMTDLERALRLAEPEGFVRLFVDLGLPMARLLQEASAREVMPDYVTRLLDAFDGQFPALAAMNASLPKLLTSREQEILGLIAAGLTNAEIGDQLFISAQTVGKHAGNIFGKLSVHNRTEAVARARAFKLLR